MPEPARLRVAILGAGTIAHVAHLPVLRSRADLDVVGVVDPSPAARTRVAEEYGYTRSHASLPELLEAGTPDCAFVLTPKQFHYATVKSLLDAGMDVFCEKPLTMRLPEAEELVRMAAAKRRILMVGFNRRYAPTYLKAREFFAGHPPEACLAMKNRPGTEYRATYENAIHMVDLLRWFCGEAVEVHGFAQFTDPYYETTAAATLRFENGAVGVLLANRSTSHWVERLEVFGHGRSAIVEAPDRVSLGREGAAEVTEMTPLHMGWAQVVDKMGFRQEVEHFLDCVRRRQEPRTSGAEAVKTQALMDRLLGAMGLPLHGKEG